MAYSNQTANYGLPQYVGSDLATWQDNTEAWAKVDSGMQANKTAAQAASTAAGQAQATANAAQSQAATANSKVTAMQKHFEFKTAPLSSNSGIEARARALIYSDTMALLKANISSLPKSSIQPYNMDDSHYWIEWMTSTVNVYQLQPTTVASDSKFWIGTAMGYVKTSNSNVPLGLNALAFWDGTATHIGYVVDKVWWDGLENTDTYVVEVSMPSFFTGTIITIPNTPG